MERAQRDAETRPEIPTLDARYELPNYRNDPINIYNFVHAHQGDLAMAVCLPFDL